MTADAVGGIWTYALDLARGLSGRGIETSIVVLGPSPTAHQREEAEQIGGVSLHDSGLSLDWLATAPAEILYAGTALGDLARDLRADIIHLNGPALAAAGAFPAPVLGACHSCLATWWQAVKEGPMPPDFAWRTRMLEAGMRACQALVAPSRWFAQATARTYQVPHPFSVHNGRTSAPVELPRDPFFFTSGRLWDEGKNLRVLDIAAGLIDIPLHAAGPLDGPGCRFAPSHLVPVGRLSAAEIADRLRRAPVYVSAALYEPFGLGVLEAAQAGCALVLSDIPTFRELWHGAALFVDPREPKAFAKGLRDLNEDPVEAHRLGGLARERARQFDVGRMTDGMIAIYSRLLASREQAA